jgi:hypothetical protein
MATLVTWDEFTAGARPQGGTIRELVLAEVTNVISAQRPLMSTISRGDRDVTNTFIEVLEDTFRSRGNNAWVEGVAATNPDLTQPTRSFTHVQSFAEFGYVSDEQRLVGHYNGDPFPYQIRKHLNQLLNDIEHADHRGSAATGATSAARQYDGMLNLPVAASTAGGTFTSSSGTTFTESVMIDLLQAFKDNNYDVIPTAAFVNSWLKRTISEFSTKVTRNVDAAALTQVLMIERHQSDFGNLDVQYSEDQLNAASRTVQGNSFIALDPRKFRHGWLRRPTVEMLPRDGLRDRFQINAQVSLVYDTRKAVGGGEGYVANIT